MSEMVELNDNELEMVAGGQFGSVNIQNNIAVIPQTAVAISVFSHGYTNASNTGVAVQFNAGINGLLE